MDYERDCHNCHYGDEGVGHPVCALCLDQIGYEGTWAPIGSVSRPMVAGDIYLIPEELVILDSGTVELSAEDLSYARTWGAPIGGLDPQHVHNAAYDDAGRIPTVAEVERFARHNPEAFEYIAAVLASERGDPT